MRNIVLLSIAAGLIIMVITVRYWFELKYDEFEKNISKYEIEQLQLLKKQKEDKIANLSKGDEKILGLFKEQFNEKRAIVERDTTFSFIYLSRNTKYRSVSFDYIDCLTIKCEIDAQNEVINNKINIKEKELEKKYGETFLIWYPKLKDDIIIINKDKSDDCSKFFPDLNEISIKENAWKDFEKFMISYNSETKKTEKQNKQIENTFTNSVTNTKSQLNSKVIGYFEKNLESRKSQIITTQTETISYDSQTLGLITYTVYKKSFDKEKFQSVANEAFEEQWKYNSLYTGAMPYSNCYGSNNYCGDWSCSKIKIITGGSGDVIVSIKNQNGDVVRHVYIRAGNSYTFDLTNGSYQVFFYSGIGWNPNKQMPSSNCSYLKGGFVSNENVTKDSYVSLYNQILTYELTLQERGNFSTQQSSKSEAF